MHALFPWTANELLYEIRNCVGRAQGAPYRRVGFCDRVTEALLSSKNISYRFVFSRVYHRGQSISPRNLFRHMSGVGTLRRSTCICTIYGYWHYYSRSTKSSYVKFATLLLVTSSPRDHYTSLQLHRSSVPCTVHGCTVFQSYPISFSALIPHSFSIR